ncbi:MAG: hypothetical protein ACFE0J_17310 [Elainellaceae cyanobacterium]
MVSKWLLAILPGISFLAYCNLGLLRGAFWFRDNQDPDYVYLFSSLMLVNFEVPAHIDHPGTPYQILGAIVLRTLHLVWFHSENLIYSVLQKPEIYLYAIYYTSIFLKSLSLFAVGWAMFYFSKNLILSLIIQTTPLVMVWSIVVRESSRVAPESLLFIISQLLIILLITYIYRDGANRKNWFWLGMGAIIGIGMATKVTFLPAILFVFLIHGFWRKFAAIGIAALTFVLATLPIISRYEKMFGWIWNLIVRKEAYGTGESGLINASSLWSNFLFLFTKSYVFFLITTFFTVVTLIVGFSLRKEKAPSALVKRCFYVAVIFCVGHWSFVFLASNERPEIHYLTFQISLIGLSISILIIFFRHLLKQFTLSQKVLKSIPAIGLTTCIVLSAYLFHTSSNRLSNVKDWYTTDAEAIQILHQDLKGCAWVYRDRASDVKAALYFADTWTHPDVLIPIPRKIYTDFSKRRFHAELSNIYPDSLFLVSVSSQEKSFNRKSYFSYSDRHGFRQVLRENGCIAIQQQAWHPAPEVPSKIKSKLDIQNVFQGYTESVFLIRRK